MMDRLSLIIFNDDNHAERIFINGEYVGYIHDIGLMIKRIIDIARDLNDDYKFKETSIYVCDDFADYDEDDEIIEKIWDFFNNCGQMSEEQIEAIENRIDELLKKKTKEITIKIQDMVLNELIESEE